MQVVIRADASHQIGIGHLMRCLTLGHMLRERGASVAFVTREHEVHVRGLIDERSFRVLRLPAPVTAGSVHSHGDADSWRLDAEQSRAAIESLGGTPDLLVVDHYALDARWERLLRPHVRRLFVIDDLADRPHDCDVLLDQNLHDCPESRYAGLVGAGTRVFVGPQYALLRREFDTVSSRLRDSGLRRLLVFFGGTDPSSEAVKVAGALRILGPDAPGADFVLGPANRNAEEIRRAAETVRGIVIIGATDQMAKLMAAADLGIGTCGGAAWERCAVSLPSLVVINAENQRDDARILHSMTAVRSLGDAATVTAERWAMEIRALRDDPAALMTMSEAAAAVMQGRTTAMRELRAALEH